MAAKPGDKVKITTKDDTYEGILMPEADNSVFVKLDSGYNVGIDKKKVKKIEVTGKMKTAKETKQKIKPKKGLKKIVILHTGGTIASKVDYTSGGVTAKFSAEDLVEMVPSITEYGNIETELVANMMSEDMMFSDHQKIAKAIKKHAEKGADGIIIGHGTDTLGYTAASLSFMFEEINIPVLVVGSQRSSDRGSSDAAMNLVCAAKFIAETDYCGVAVCLHHDSSDDYCAIVPGTKARKMHTSRRDAFKAINSEPIAIVAYKGKVKFNGKHACKAKKIVLKDKFDESVALLKTTPNMDPKLFEFYCKNYKGIVIEGTGLGHAPTNLGKNNLANYETLKKYIAKGGLVAITSQCIFGRVNPNVYTNLRRLADIGCIFCEDMFAETAYIKLSWLLGNYPKKAKELLSQNIRGEITECTKYEEEFCKQ